MARAGGASGNLETDIVRVFPGKGAKHVLVLIWDLAPVDMNPMRADRARRHLRTGETRLVVRLTVPVNNQQDF